MASLEEIRSGFYRDYPDAGKPKTAPTGETPEERARKIRLQQIMSSRTSPGPVPLFQGREIRVDQGAPPPYPPPTGDLAPGAGRDVAQLGMAPRTPEQSSLLAGDKARVESLLGGATRESTVGALRDSRDTLARADAAQGGMVPTSFNPDGTVATYGTSAPTVTTLSVATPQPIDRRAEASAKWRESLSITDPQERERVRTQLLTDYMDVADPKFLESRGLMGPPRPANLGQPTLAQPMTAFAPRPGSREFNEAIRGERAMASTLGRAAREARNDPKQGGALGAAGIMADTITSGFNVRPGSRAAREQNLLERTMARRASEAVTAAPYSGFIQKPKFLGDSQQQPGTQMNYRKF